MSWQIVEGDCVEVMAGMDAGSVDAVVCDPPYHLSFMGRAWDHAPTGAESRAMHEAWAREALRVLKPGGHLLAFGGTRTSHRLACAVEDAGFEIRDSLMWLYASGFPKSLDVGKAIDKAAGAEREVLGPNPTYRDSDAAKATQAKWNGAVLSGTLTAPSTPEAKRWDGFGTALKPAHEPVVVARKPLSSTVAGTVLEYGTGALNIAACRIGETVETWPASRSYAPGQKQPGGAGGETQSTGDAPAGRWPANVVLSHADCGAECEPGCPVFELDQQSGDVGGNSVGAAPGTFTTSGYAKGWTGAVPFDYGDKGGASRFFFVAKASSAERNLGLHGERNTHPTVKPVELMRWLVRLVCPPGGLILDPFAGSGTTGIAALREGFDFVGIERESEYVEIARARIIGDAPLLNMPGEAA